MRGVLLGLLVANAAYARPAVRLQTSGMCDLGELRARVVALAGRDPFADDASMRVTVATAVGDTDVTATIALDASAPRIVAAASCDGLLDPIALVIAMALPVEAAAVTQVRDLDPSFDVESGVDLARPVDRRAVYVSAAATGAGRQAAVGGVRWRDGRRSLAVEGRGDPGLGRDNQILAVASGTDGAIAFAGYVDQPIDFGTGPVQTFGQTDIVIGMLDPAP